MSSSESILDTIKIPDVPDIFAHHARQLIQSRVGEYWKEHGTVLTPPKVDKLGPTEQEPIMEKVAILGAGVGGLYTAMMLHSLGLDFDIIEASDRVGGRLYTHHFSKERYDYFDVGAMRFPSTRLMRRLFELFKSGQLNDHGLHFGQHIIEYKFGTGENFNDFNGIRARKSDVSDFKWEDTGVPKEFLDKGAEAILEEVYRPFYEPLWEDLKTGGNEGWKKLMAEDTYSTRGYLAIKKHFSYEVINWLETTDTSSGGFDRAFSENVIEAMAFGMGNPEGANFKWYCLRGGSEVLSQTMKDYIVAQKPNCLLLNNYVTALKKIPNEAGSAIGVEVHIQDEATPRRYQAVISTLPLPTLRTLDLDRAGISTNQWNAMRQLRYGPSIKIGIKFKSQWWKKWNDLAGVPLNIEGGQSSTDRPVRTIVYPSYGIEGEFPPPRDPIQPSDLTKVLIATYTWTEDANRIGGLMGEIDTNPKAKRRLKEVVIRDVAKVHNVSYEDLMNEVDGDNIFAWNWSVHPLTQGAFALFGPQSFSGLYSSMTTPAAGNHLFFAGEALSIRHAWVVGALNSAWRAVSQYLALYHGPLLPDFEREWGTDEEWTTTNEFRDHWKTWRVNTGAQSDLLWAHMAVTAAKKGETKQ